MLIICVGLSAQQTKKVGGEYTYHPPENVTLEEAKRTALERLKTQLIAEEFGTVVAQANTTFVENTDGKSSIDFQSLAASEVKGEWIETIGEPKYDISYEQGMLVVKVEVEGRIREITAAKVEFTAKILCNGTEDRYEHADFKHGDDLYLSFSSPTDGYLTVYLLDTHRDAYCLLPYQSDADGKVSIEHGKRYVFFSPKDAPREEAAMVDEYYMTCEKAIETNFLYLIFSPNGFTKASDAVVEQAEEEDELPRMLPFTDFQNWLEHCRRRDKEMTVEVRQITIRNEQK